MVKNVLFLCRTVKHNFFFFVCQIPKRHICTHSHFTAYIRHQIPHQRSPWRYRSFIDCQTFIRNQHRPVHSTHNTGAAAGLAGSLAVKSQFLRGRRIKFRAALRTNEWFLCGNCQCRRYIMTIWTAVTGQTGIHQPQAVQQLGPRTKSAPDSRHAGTLMQSQCRRYI